MDEVFIAHDSFTIEEMTAIGAGFPLQAMAKDLKTHLQFLEASATVVDISGNGNDATKVSSPTTSEHFPITQGNVIYVDFTPAVSGITGAANTIIAAFTGSAAGFVTVQGVASTTMAAFTGSAAGFVTIQGNASTTMTAFTGAAVGKIKITGNGNATISAITGVATGSIGIMGDALSTMSAFTGSATDSVGGGGMAPALRMLLRM